MPGFYRRPTPGAAISQGDLFIDVPVIGVSVAPMHEAIPDGDKFRVEPIDPDRITAGTMLVEYVALTRAMVISQSCDAERAPSLMLAPVSAFPLEGSKAPARWRKINLAATSLNETKLVYLPGNPTLQLARSAADFGEAFTVSRVLLEELERRGKRVASLGEKAIAYLQFRFGVMLTRVAQDDYAWPSCEDIEIKIAALDDRLKEARTKATKAEKAVQAAETAGAAAAELDELRAESEEQQAEVAAIEQEITIAKAAKDHADDLAS